MRRRKEFNEDTALFSPLLDVLMNGLGAILLLLFIYAYFMRRQGEGPPPIPPIVILSEDDEVYRFSSGSAELSPAFRSALEAKVLPLLEKLTAAYQCDVIEVVGHTDGQPIGRGGSNLDNRLLAALRSGDLRGLAPGSNIDLGVMRAGSVIGTLQNQHLRGRLPGVRRFLPYSSGQCILPNQQTATEEDRMADPRRRRIEIRLLQSGSWRSEQAAH